MNHNAPDPNMADNISDGLRKCVNPRWEKPSPQIIIGKCSETDPIYVIMLKSTIHGRLVNS